MGLWQSEFYGNIIVGNPGKTFKVSFDTTWSTPWLISRDCPTKVIGCLWHSKYDHSHSSTYKENGTKFNVNEGSFNFTGYYSEDSLSIGQIRVHNQTFVEMTYVPSMYLYTKSDGVMGLGFSKGVTPFFFNMLKNGTIKKPVFSVYLSRDRQSKKGGSIILGSIEPKHIHEDNHGKKEEITYLPVDISNGFWQFLIDRIIMDDGQKSNIICGSSWSAIADISNTNILGPKDQIEKVHSLIHAKPFMFGLYEVDCETINKLPRIDFVLAGKNFTLTGKQYVQRRSVALFTACISAFTPIDTPSEENFWIIGGAFLSQYYSVYDIENQKIGFVTAA